MKIYVVVGAYGTGEWDHTEWDVAYYDNEDAANDHMTKASTYKGEFNPYDRMWRYGGASYHVRRETVFNSVDKWKQDG